MPFSELHPAGVAIVGAGNIARRYVGGLERFPQLRLLGCTDVIPAAAESLAAEAGIAAYPSLEALLDDPAVDVVVNITPPVAHAAVTQQALAAGKHVYVEKPITTTLEDAQCVLDAAEAAGRLVGSAPDTFLGSAGQTARAAVDAGLIGTPIGATAFVTHSRAETWHPDPTFLFQPGGGPTLDLGPYYVTALVNCLGPVEQVVGCTRIGAPHRTVTAPDRRVDTIEVTTPTHCGAVLRFTSGVIATVMMSFDVWDSRLPKLELYGDIGTLTLPDPNEFDGDVLLKQHADSDWSVLAPSTKPSGAPGSASQHLRGMGVADLAAAVDGAPSRASAQLARHVLEVLDAIQRASESATAVAITSRVERPAPAEDARPRTHSRAPSPTR